MAKVTANFEGCIDKVAHDAIQAAINAHDAALSNLLLGTAPATATSPGTKGQLAFDATHLYVCIATNTWIRAAFATF